MHARPRDGVRGHTSIATAIAEPVFTHQERLALAGFLAGYTGLTRDAYPFDLRQFTAWCQQRHRSVRRVGVSAIACRDAQIRSIGSLPHSVMHVEGGDGRAY